MKKPAKQSLPPVAAKAESANASVSFRSARSSLSQITADLERLRQHAASLVKAAHRPAK